MREESPVSVDDILTMLFSPEELLARAIVITRRTTGMLGVELEHGPRDPETDVSGNDPIVTGKIALAHLTEYPDYYTRLAVLEREAAADLRKK